MLIYPTASGPVKCRTVSVPVCERDCDASTDIEALALFHIKLRDKLDFTVDFTEWLAANGGAVLTGATFTIASTSPKTPTLSAQAFNPAGKALVVLLPAVDAVVGDAYYLDITAQIAATVAVLPTDVVIPARTMVRRINVVVDAG